MEETRALCSHLVEMIRVATKLFEPKEDENINTLFRLQNNYII